ncbi:MAG: YceI family protein [Actinomycetota bacterium]|nr:YceI family protein [Actinomycetota bacterium]
MTSFAMGDFDIGPSNGRLRLRTYRQGLAAKAGHDLVLEAAEWHGRVHVLSEADGSASVAAEIEVEIDVEIEVEIDLRRLEVREGTGGVKPLTERDRADIRKAMRQPLGIDAQPIATFRSSSVRVEGERATVEGELSIAGQSHPVELDVRREADGTISGSTQIVQSAWGIKPYAGFFGALKLRDAVDVEFVLQLPG